uniref:Uncharacterized protein n=1 Tax=Arundo donax TaxID=35708 RepID=A0A0A8ZNE0_ARUDO
MEREREQDWGEYIILYRRQGELREEK